MDNTHENIPVVSSEEITYHPDLDLLRRSVEALDMYLNAGDKEQRRSASENAKCIYKEYYGVDYKNIIER